MSPEFEAAVRHEQGIPVLDMRGELIGSSQGVLNAALSDAERERPEAVVLNFSRVEYINSKGIALLVMLLRQAQAGGYELAAYGLSAHYQEIFDITQLADYIEVFEDEGSALSVLRLSI